MPSTQTKSQSSPRSKSTPEGAPPVVAVEGMPPLTGRLSLLPRYLATRVAAHNESLRARGVDVIDLGMGNPVDPVAPNVVEALKKSLNEPKNHRYSSTVGIKPLREAFARHYARHYN